MNPFCLKLLLYCLLVFCFLPPAIAKLADDKWVFSPVVGLYRPALESIYEDAYQAPFVGESSITTDIPEDIEGEASYPTEKFLFDNALNKNFAGPEAGLEFRRTFGKQDDFYLGISTFEVTSKAIDEVEFPLQGQLKNIAVYERRAKLSLTQYFIGWRHYLYQKTVKNNFYVNLSLHEMFDIDYKENHVFTFIEGAPAGFKRIMVFQAQATGILMLQMGIGGERHFTDRFSVGLEGGFAFGIGKIGNLKGISRRDDFNEGDRLEDPKPAPLRPAVDNNVAALSPDANSQVNVRIRLDGWRIALKFNVTF